MARRPFGNPGIGLGVAAVVLGSAVGLATGWMKSKSGPTTTDAGVPPTATGSQIEDAGPAIAADVSLTPSWIDQVDAAEPPPESQLDPEYLLSLVDMNVSNADTIKMAQTMIAGRRHHANQGNYKIAHHKVSRRQCLEGLRTVELQTPAQREICGGPYEVPVHRGDPLSATSCIDVFEYPNKPCVLPFVHTYGMQGEAFCALTGKRLCTDEEWNTSCEADPKGGPDWQYAYGNELDLGICATGGTNGHCRINDDLWGTCETNTEPNGAFPKCRSRLGVFDQHGNIAEAMHRWEDGIDYIQLKGSAFFYDGKMYKDHCRFDPRWHVDKFKESWHDNYHLGFRCCRGIKSMKQRMMEGDSGVSLVNYSDASIDAELAAESGKSEYEDELDDASPPTIPPPPPPDPTEQPSD